ncbi:uncharacterized protein LOC129567323 [Sitodiplosis mosellana]|uniref:uncharacterized protein LOC129567323 n=1 Tax=Sitodiplosis mosellana TaxID=263140 RepID=UPI00244383A3|nr:uncharacterized protein LOC129567323 [Sitodiplosis mosellana]
MVDFDLKLAYCCCFDLRTGGLVIGYFQLTLWALDFLLKVSGLTFGSFLVYGLLFGVHGCWVYGVHTESTSFMVPGVIFEMICYALILLALAIIPILGLTLGEKIHELIPDKEQAASAANLGAALFYVLFISFALGAALQWLFTAVKYSLYKQMKEEEADQSNARPSANDKF